MSAYDKSLSDKMINRIDELVAENAALREQLSLCERERDAYKNYFELHDGDCREIECGGCSVCSKTEQARSVIESLGGGK